MAQTYDVYLRDRLTKFDIIIRNLTYREYLTIHHVTYLDAMVNYLCLQKFILGGASSELRTKIDNLLEQVFCLYNNSFELRGDVSTLSAKWTGASSTSELDISMLSKVNGSKETGYLKTRSGQTICTRDGEELRTWARVSETAYYDLGEIHTRSGNAICTRDGNVLVARKKPADPSFHEECFNSFQDITQLTSTVASSLYKETGASSTSELDISMLSKGYEVKNNGSIITQSGNVLYTRSGQALEAWEKQTNPPFHEECFERFGYNQQLFDLIAQVAASAESFAECALNSELTTDEFDIFYLVTVQGEALMSLLCAPPELEHWYVIYPEEISSIFCSESPDVYADTYLAADYIFALMSEITEILNVFAHLEDADSTLEAVGEVVLRRYRLMNEMDGSPLEYFDALSLDDLDYVVLE